MSRKTFPTGKGSKIFFFMFAYARITVNIQATLNKSILKKITFLMVRGILAIIISFCFPSQKAGPGNFMVKGSLGL